MIALHEAIALMTKLRGILNAPGFPGSRDMREAMVARLAGDETRLRALLAVGEDGKQSS